MRVAPASARKTARVEDTPAPVLPLPTRSRCRRRARSSRGRKKRHPRKNGPSISEKKPIATSWDEAPPLKGAVELLKPEAAPDSP